MSAKFGIIRNMKTKTLLLATVAAVGAFGASAKTRTWEISAWRGETLAVRLPDNVELGAVPEGISLKVGAALPVKFLADPQGLQLAEAYDRVRWGAPAGGPRFVEIAVPADAKPGVYACGMMRLKVVDRVLPPPKEWKYYLDLWQHPWAVARHANVRPFSKEHYAAMRPVYELLATAGQKAVTVTILEQPWGHQCYDAYHSLVDDPDFRTFDEYVSFCFDCGLGPDISCYSLCPWILDEEPGTPEFEKRWAPFLTRFAKHLKEKGWLGRTLMAMDEREPAQVKAIADLVRKCAPGLRISLAGNRKPSEFKGIDIDVYSQILSYATPDFLAEVPARRARGFVTTQYVCCWPRTPNTFMTSRPAEAFWWGACPAMLGLDGALRWAWNSWPQDPVRDASFGDWLAGDTFLCYPGGEPSVRFLELRNGVIAAEKVRLLKEKGLFAKDLGELAKSYELQPALKDTCDFAAVRAKTMAVVNKE